MSDEIRDGRSRPAEEADVAHLLRLAGARPLPSSEREQRVRAAVMQQWRSSVGARRRRRLAVIGALAAVAASAVLIVRLGWPFGPATPPRAPFGAIERVDGADVTITRPDAVGAVTVAPGAAISTGDELTTGAASRLALQSNGLSIRLDRQSRVRIAGLDTVTLIAGTVYVDSGPGEPSLRIDTRLGTVRDIGTQFEVRLDADTLRIRVRSGLVEVQRNGESLPARPGTELMISRSGTARRGIAPFGPDWEWTVGLAPSFDVEGRSLGVFLEHLCREQGWTLVWADRQLPLEASGIIMHGSFEGLTAADQVRVALSTSGLGHRLDNGELTVFRPGR